MLLHLPYAHELKSVVDFESCYFRSFFVIQMDMLTTVSKRKTVQLVSPIAVRCPVVLGFQMMELKRIIIYCGRAEGMAAS